MWRVPVPVLVTPPANVLGVDYEAAASIMPSIEPFAVFLLPPTPGSRRAPRRDCKCLCISRPNASGRVGLSPAQRWLPALPTARGGLARLRRDPASGGGGGAPWGGATVRMAAGVGAAAGALKPAGQRNTIRVDPVKALNGER